uniref:Putative boophilin n=2 Tax=Ixodes ricinus TaxID=34613 RepID=A0A090XC06_IXORI
MKVLLVIFLVGTVAAQWNEICKLSPDKGVCRGRISRFYVQPDVGTMLALHLWRLHGQPRTISGQSKIVRRRAKTRYKRGYCKGFLDRWFFNVTSGACETFLYSGCGGNLDEYESQWECEFACKG